jgi:molybdopterin synthase catalytic subunit
MKKVLLHHQLENKNNVKEHSNGHSNDQEHESLCSIFEFKKTNILISISNDEIDEKFFLKKLVKDSSCGAVTIFKGLTRDDELDIKEHTRCNSESENSNNAIARVEYLFYEAYIPLAQKLMKEIALEACNNEKWPDLRGIGIIHRLGRLLLCLPWADYYLGRVNPGECSIIVITASPHRKDSIFAMDWIMDTVKAKVPIFKKEFYRNGQDGRWMENKESCCRHNAFK